MKVLTNPLNAAVKTVQNFDGAVIVARWASSGSLTSFRYHSYDGAWYCVGEDKKYSAQDIIAATDVYAIFYDEAVA